MLLISNIIVLIILCLIFTKLSARMEENEIVEAEFLNLIPKKMAEPPWNYTGTLEKGLKASLCNFI